MIYEKWKEYDFNKIKSAEIIKEGRKQYKAPARHYLDIITAFDIEFTNLEDIKQSVMYIWQFAINNDVVLGRTWEELIDFEETLNSAIPSGAFLVTYVHNLECEFQFLKSRFEISGVLATDAHAVIKCDIGKIEMRCSARHSGQNLREYLRAQKVPAEYQKRTLDYKKRRFPWTELTKEEKQYCINDVLGLVKAITNELKKDGENLATIPLTVTGYARRDARATLYKSRCYYWECLQNDPDLMDALRGAFRGGNTHANRYYVTTDGDPIITENCICYDISSSYPAVLLTEKLPQKFRHEEDPATLFWHMERGRACLARVHMENVRLKNPAWPIPYIATAKLERGRGITKDNGRVLKAESIEFWATEIDLYIIQSEYYADITCIDLWTAKKAMLPIGYRTHLLDLYKTKTELKGTDRKSDYSRAKKIFDSNYGMMVQNPVKKQWKYNPKKRIIEEDTETPEEIMLSNYEENGLMPYQWGVWCTALARLRLERGIKAIKPEEMIYVDTDSLHFLNTPENVEAVEKLNEELKKAEMMATDKNGIVHFIGTYELENKEEKFATMGAKKYVTEKNGKIEITIAGVNKEKGGEELQKMENFRKGYVFKEAGGLTAYYNNYGRKIEIEGRKIETGTNIYLENTEYTLGISDDYERLLDFLATHDAKRGLYLD